jgi:hypothetical protein
MVDADTVAVLIKDGLVEADRLIAVTVTTWLVATCRSLHRLTAAELTLHRARGDPRTASPPTGRAPDEIGIQDVRSRPPPGPRMARRWRRVSSQR